MNKNTKVLALKYRPAVFEDLVGQDIVRDTILNSINENKVPNAYLFTGIRGVGKTTIARIVAKALNCKKGLGKVCKEDMCENCDSISNSNHIDVLEMDAASKTGVDDVRDLIEFSRYGPTSSKYKIFIIDEVHMLSKQAFNALLKTLEEPPKYLKFIFATTEIKKIPVTVVSRCQRFDLARIKSSELFQFINCIKEKQNEENVYGMRLNFKPKYFNEKFFIKDRNGNILRKSENLDNLISKTSWNKLHKDDIEQVRNIFDSYTRKNFLIFPLRDI